MGAAPGTARTAATVAVVPSARRTGSPMWRELAGSQPWSAVSQGWRAASSEPLAQCTGDAWGLRACRSTTKSGTWVVALQFSTGDTLRLAPGVPLFSHTAPSRIADAHRRALSHG
jgi:hypothetical protein